MKQIKSTLILAILLLSFQALFSQITNHAISYQASARLDDGNFVVNKQITVEISIIASTASGQLIYREIHYPFTNSFGFFSIEIGRGFSTFDGLYTDFNMIDWASESYFLNSRVDFGEEDFLNGLIDMGTVELLSVPYSFVAEKAHVADSLSLPLSISLTQLFDVNINSPLDKEFIAWDADLQKWITADPTGDPGTFVRTDGSSDLIGDWTISSNNIILTNGGIYSNYITSSIGATINEFSTDLTLSDSSNIAIPTERAVKTYIDNSFLNAPWLSNSNYIYVVNNKNVGIGTATPSHKFELQLLAGEGILVEGIYGGAIPDLDVGARFTYYPAKAAIRAGRILNNTDYWNNTNVGNYSAAFGLDTKASGTASFAAGENNAALSTGSVSFGRNNSSSSLYSFTAGYSNTATGMSALVSGYENTAHGDYSAIFGKQCQTGNSSGAGGDYSLVFGELSVSEADHALVGGFQNIAKGDYSFVGGYNSQNTLNALSSFVYGYQNQALAYYTFSSGNNTISASYAETAMGNFNYSWGGSYNSWNTSDVLFALGNGTDDLNRQNALTILKNGNLGIALGQSKPNYLLEVGINGDGTVAVANSWNLFSDLRLKKNLQKIENPMEKLMQINGYYFYWKTAKDTSRQVGIIAQELEIVIPEIVSENKKGYKTVNYSGLNPLIIEAIKQQYTYITKLQNENKLIKEENELLKKKLEENSLRINNIEEYIKASSEVNILKSK